MALDKENKAPKPDRAAPAAKKAGIATNAITLDAANPIPIEFNSQVFVSLKGKRYVPFLNPIDHFAQLLTEASTLSLTTKSCIESKAKYCLGKGVMLTGEKGKTAEEADKDFQLWCRNVNRDGQSFNDILNQYFLNKLTSGNAYVQIVRTELGGRRDVKLYVRNYLDCRLAFPDEDDHIDSVYISKYFRKLGIWFPGTNKTEEIALYTGNMFDTNWTQDEKGFRHSIIHLKHYTSGYDYYGMPSNLASLPQQILEYKAARYNLDNFENNMVIGGVVVVKGPMSDDEARKFGKDLIYSHTGDGKHGRWLIVSKAEGMPEGVEIKEFQKNKDGDFIEFDTRNSEKIYIANHWNKLLCGGSENKNIGSGNSAYIRSVFDLAKTEVIEPEQTYAIEKLIKPILDICSEWMGKDWNRYEPEFKQISPLSFLGDLSVNSLLTVDEGRKEINKPALGTEDGSKLITTVGKAPQPTKPEPDVQD